MAAGDSAVEMAAAARARAARAERVADAWARGAAGEAALAAAMAPLGADGYYRLDDRCVPGSSANLDHLLIGPAGVFLVDAKTWTGDVHVENGSLRQNGRRRDDHLTRLVEHTRVVAGVLDGPLPDGRVPVRPVLCFTGDGRIGAPQRVNGTQLLNGSDLVDYVRQAPRRLDQVGVDEVVRW